MNNKTSRSYVILIIAPLFFGCGGAVNEKQTANLPASALSSHVGTGKYLKVDTAQSVVEWKGSSVQGAHSGYVYISKGELMIENGQVTGGTIEVDMSTIQDEDHRSDNGLIEHLKNPDFFDVKKFPFSTIKITRVASINGENKNVTGNLTIKGITHPVTFAAMIAVKDGIVTATGKLIIDRTKWGIRYNSGKFFDNLADNTISDSVEFEIRIVAK